MRIRLIFMVIFLLLFTACSANSNEGGPANSKDVVSEGCPYNGAIVEMKYHNEITFEEIKDIWSDNGWQMPNPEADGHTIVGMISGSFEESKWITTSAHKSKEMTIISVWVNQEVDEMAKDLSD